MNILIQLSHPAHFHLFKNIARNLMNDGHSIFIIIKSKDILESLLKESNLPYYNVLREDHRKSKVGILLDLIIRNCRILFFARRHHVDLFIGSTVEIAQIGWLMRKPRINFGEDDAAIIPQFITIAGKFISTYMAPTLCKMGKLEQKTIHYAGYHKLAYLHPNVFTPDKAVVAKYFSPDKPYFILRFAKLKAYHDLSADAKGINTDVAQNLINILSPYGDIYITSERELEPQFEQYRLHINPLDIHHLLAYSKLYIGDSQSMAVEAAMLGTPSIRFNDFAGKIGVLEELEHKYGLTFGIPSSQPQLLYEKVKELLAMPTLTEEFHNRKTRMLSEKIDVTAFFTWFIENYPQSKQIMKENPDYQYRFR